MKMSEEVIKKNRDYHLACPCCGRVECEGIWKDVRHKIRETSKDDNEF